MPEIIDKFKSDAKSQYIRDGMIALQTEHNENIAAINEYGLKQILILTE